MPKSPPLEVLYEDNHLLVVNKPVGLATQGAMEGAASVVTRAKEYLKRKYKKPGNVFVGVVSRLDASVSGVLVLARTSKAAARLTEQFTRGEVEKVYWALVERPPDPPQGELSHWLLKDDRQRLVVVVPHRTRGAQHARLSYRTLPAKISRRAGTRPGGPVAKHQATLLEIQLHTGRKHQIRVQLSAIGCPILGDRKYGSRQTFIGEGIALHCVRLAIQHPTSGQRLQYEAPPPNDWGLEDRGGRGDA